MVNQSGSCLDSCVPGDSSLAKIIADKSDSVLRKGYIQVYYGTGKGKTTAALGLSLRMLLSGGSVYFAQFLKGLETSEQELGSLCDRFIIEQFGTGRFVRGEPTKEDIGSARKGLDYCREVLKSGHFDLVVMDEVMLCSYYQIATPEEIIDVLLSKKPSVEVVITGRIAPKELVLVGDLVTDMKKVKHYFDKGVNARRGIEY